MHELGNDQPARTHAGVSRGCGWQHLAALTNLVAFYFVGMPLAIFLAFKLKFYTKVNSQSTGISSESLQL
jgi:hypothetical protein